MFLAKKILRHIMRFRRLTHSQVCCDIETCEACLVPHLKKVEEAIKEQRPISFVLPAFPGKSPNLAKVLGPLPDMAEEQALIFLNELCNQVKQLYAFGAKILLCSDGRVFSDVIGMKEEDVTNYQQELRQMIQKHHLTNLSTFSLDELQEGNSFSEMRQDLMQKHGQSVESLQEKVRRGGTGSQDPDDIESHRIYCGITRFLLEDSMHPGQTKSKSAIQKDCRLRAYEVIRRSNAWSELIEENFRHAVRLSIHPQTCGSKKLGIQLIGTQSWMTPWHGVAVETSDGYVLMKRCEAEKLNVELVQQPNKRASHYRLLQHMIQSEKAV